MLIAEPSTNTAQQREKYVMLCIYIVCITNTYESQKNTIGFVAVMIVLFYTYQFYSNGPKLLFSIARKDLLANIAIIIPLLYIVFNLGCFCFILVVAHVWVSSLAYPNLLESQRLCCYRCCSLFGIDLLLSLSLALCLFYWL